MQWINSLFHYICGQSRCFEINSTALPVCQRCLGLYVGSAITGIYLLLTRIWHRGLPSISMILLHIILLITAMAGGLHIIDIGPIWRLFCGVCTGHVILLWLVSALVNLFHLSYSRDLQNDNWSSCDKIWYLVHLAVMCIFIMSFTVLKFLGWYFWTVVVVLGVLFLLGVLFCLTCLFLRILITKKL